jgi:hypothetical protein
VTFPRISLDVGGFFVFTIDVYKICFRPRDIPARRIEKSPMIPCLFFCCKGPERSTSSEKELQ